MPQVLSTDQIGANLRMLGLRPGDTVFIFADLRTPGSLHGIRDRTAFCEAYLASIREVIGAEGTIVVPTYTTQVARFDVPFILEQTPSVTGVFAEHVRMQPEAKRSVHPIHSLTALGPLADTLCQGNGTCDYGWDSPFHRLHQTTAKILSIGLPSGYALGIGHYIEAMCGLPYVYNKLLQWQPIVDGREDPRPFFSSVRHLNVTFRYDFSRWAQAMAEARRLVGCRFGRSAMFLSDFGAAVDIATAAIRQDPYFLLAAPPKFVKGELPFDGPTANRDGLNLTGENQPAATQTNWTGLYIGASSSITSEDIDRKIIESSLAA